MDVCWLISQQLKEIWRPNLDQEKVLTKCYHMASVLATPPDRVSVSELWVPCFRHELRQGSTLFPTTRWGLYPWHEAPSTVSIKPEAKLRFAGYYFKRGDPSYKKAIVVKTTQKYTVWAVHVFTSWAKEENEHSDQECPTEVFSTSITSELRHRLCVFVKEARHNNGQPYTLNYFLAYSASPIRKYITLLSQLFVLIDGFHSIFHHRNWSAKGSCDVHIDHSASGMVK